MIDWNDNAKAAVECFAGYVGEVRAAKIWLSEKRPTQTKTVADAVEAFPDGWPEKEMDVCVWDMSRNKFLFWVANYAKVHDCYEVCTRAEFEAYVKEREGEKWTHVVNFGFSEQAQCKIISENGDFLWVQVDGVGCPATYKKSELKLKPVKPKLTKAQAWDKLFVTGLNIDDIVGKYDITD